MAKTEVFVSQGRTPVRTCPACQHVLDAVTGLSVDPGDRAPLPAPGDITTCAYCRTVLVFTLDQLRVATAQDFARLEPELRQIVLAYIASGGRRPD